MVKLDNWLAPTIWSLTFISYMVPISTSLSYPFMPSLASIPASASASTSSQTTGHSKFLDPLNISNPPNQRSSRSSRSSFCTEPSLLPTPRPLTALASFPGSGNTWIRYLIQQSSGYLTGSVYHDAALSMKGFPGEGVSNGSMVVIKTHQHEATTGPLGQPFTKAIFLIRNPFKVLLSEFNRQSGGHLGHAPASKFTDTGWRNWVLENIDSWSSFTLDWLNFKGPLLVIRYENCLNNLQTELTRMLTFLEVNFTSERLSCVDKHRNGWQRRPQHFLPFDPFAMPSSSNLSLPSSPSSSSASSASSASAASASASSSISSSLSLRQVVDRKRKLVYQAVNNFLRQTGQLSSISQLP